MKTKLVVAGLLASAAFVGCTNDEFMTTTENPSDAKGETLLVFDGFGGADTKLAYVDQHFQWQKEVMGARSADEIGVRRVSENGVDVISNSRFYVQGTSDTNEGDPAEWTGAQGDYACFATEFETLHEADYIVTYPYDRKAVHDGKVTGKLAVMQVANKNDGELYGVNNEYAGNYGFMMSTATHFVGGQNVGHFVLYPVFARLQFNVTHSTNQSDVQLQSIILKSKSGAKVFPTELEVSADVTPVGNYLDESKMAATENNMTDQIALTVNGEKAPLDASTPQTFYLTVIPGTYATDDLELKFVTNKGSYSLEPSGESVTWETGTYYPINVNITEFEPNRDYIAADAYSWMQAMKNISNLTTGDGNQVDIRVAGEIQMTEAQFRAAAMNNNQNLNVIDGGNGSIVITDGLDNATGADAVTNTLATTTFNIPVTVNGNFTNLRNDENLTFGELKVTGDLYPNNDLVNANYKKLVVNGGEVGGATTYHASMQNAAMTLNNMTLKGLVTVSAMTGTGNSEETKTTKVNFNNCTFETGLTVADIWQGSVATVNGGRIANSSGTAVLKVGNDVGNTKNSKVYLKGDVEVDKVVVEKVYDGSTLLDLLGNLTVNTEVEMGTNGGRELFIERDATLTLGESATFTANTEDLVIEGTLVNDGEFIVNAGIVLSDDDQNNNHRGTISNNGFLMAPAAEWYDDQHINVTHNSGCEYVISSVANVSEFRTAVAIPNVTGVQLTGNNYSFSANSNYADYDLYVAADASFAASNGQFGNVAIESGKKLTVDNGAAHNTIFGDVTVNGTLEVDSPTTVACGDLLISRGGTLINGVQVTCDSFTNNGTVQNGNPTKR